MGVDPSLFKNCPSLGLTKLWIQLTRVGPMLDQCDEQDFSLKWCNRPNLPIDKHFYLKTSHELHDLGEWALWWIYFMMIDNFSEESDRFQFHKATFTQFLVELDFWGRIPHIFVKAIPWMCRVVFIYSLALLCYFLTIFVLIDSFDRLELVFFPFNLCDGCLRGLHCKHRSHKIERT